MIQRIQTIYLLLVTILSIVCLCFPIATFLDGTSISEFYNLYICKADGTVDYAPWALFVIQLLSALISFTTIFLYKKRMLQIRFTIFNIIINIGYYVSSITFIFMLIEKSQSVSINWPICLPFVNIVLSWLAVRAIGKDEMLVKAYDRLR